MDTLFSSWVIVCAGFTVMAVVIVAFLRHRAGRSRRPSRVPRETPMVALVRRRRELTAQLHDLAGDGGSDLLQSEARRMRSSKVDIAVLEAAVARAERNTANAELAEARGASLATQPNR